MKLVAGLAGLLAPLLTGAAGAAAVGVPMLTKTRLDTFLPNRKLEAYAAHGKKADKWTETD